MNAMVILGEVVYKIDSIRELLLLAKMSRERSVFFSKFISALIARLNIPPSRSEDTVSYTHLDVYKRQILYYQFFT